MRRILAVVFLLLASTAGAQTDEMLVGSNFESGGFGGPVFKLTSFDGETRFMAGGRGGWIINRSIVLGGGGYGFTSDEGELTAYGRGQLGFGYGGLELEYVVRPSQLLHYSVFAHFGGGGVSFEPEDGEDEEVDDGVFVFEPGATLELNITHWFRCNVGGSYRAVSGLRSDSPLKDSDLAGPSLLVMLKFGKF